MNESGNERNDLSKKKKNFKYNNNEKGFLNINESQKISSVNQSTQAFSHAQQYSQQQFNNIQGLSLEDSNVRLDSSQGTSLSQKPQGLSLAEKERLISGESITIEREG